jgi:hypothetical protein
MVVYAIVQGQVIKAIFARVDARLDQMTDHVKTAEIQGEPPPVIVSAIVLETSLAITARFQQHEIANHEILPMH